MVKFTNLLKSFLIKWYVLLIVLCVCFGANFVAGKLIKDDNSDGYQITDSVYTSYAHMSIFSNSENIKTDDILKYTPSVINRIRCETFTNLVLENMKDELDKDASIVDEEYIEKLKGLTFNSFKNITKIEIIEGTSTIRFSAIYENAKVAQFINECLVNTTYDLLVEGDSENIISSSVINSQLGFSIDTKPQLPTQAEHPNSQYQQPVKSGLGNMRKIDLLLISVLIWVLIVAIYDCAIGYLTNLHKVKTFVQAEVVSEINIPMRSARKNNKEE